MKGFFFLMVLVLGVVSCRAAEIPADRFSVSSEIGWHNQYFGPLFGCVSQDDPALQGWITVADKKTGIYFNEWQSRHAASLGERNFNWENDHTLGVNRQVSKNLNIDTAIIYFDLVSQSTDWWASDTTIRYTRNAKFQPFLRLCYLVPTNNTITNGGIVGKVGVSSQVAKGLSMTASIGAHGPIMGVSSKLSFAQLIVTQDVPLDKRTTLSVSGLIQKKLSDRSDYVSNQMTPTMSVSLARTFN